MVKFYERAEIPFFQNFKNILLGGVFFLCRLMKVAVDKVVGEKLDSFELFRKSQIQPEVAYRSA